MEGIRGHYERTRSRDYHETKFHHERTRGPSRKNKRTIIKKKLEGIRGHYERTRSRDYHETKLEGIRKPLQQEGNKENKIIKNKRIKATTAKFNLNVCHRHRLSERQYVASTQSHTTYSSWLLHLTVSGREKLKTLEHNSEKYMFI